MVVLHVVAVTTWVRIPGLAPGIAQLGERQTEDLEVTRSIRVSGICRYSSVGRASHL